VLIPSIALRMPWRTKFRVFSWEAGYRLKSAKALTTSGPYAFVRNPIYVGNTLLVLGVVVLFELVWLVPLAGLWCAGVYALVVRHEERRLLARYGAAYHAYQAAVPRWRPRVTTVWAGGSGRAPLLHALRVECHIALLVAPVIFKELLLARFLE
jgi:protein-S-isoprenylcysteine O-methyltransferase Ste14